MATWADFKAQIRKELEEVTSGIWDDSQLLWWTNEAAYDIAIRTKPTRDWQYTTTVVGQSTYTLPVGSLEVIAVYCGLDANDDRKMLTRAEFRDVFNVDHDNGTPTHYIIDDDAIRLVPTPDKQYELSFLRYALPAQISVSTDDMPFGSHYNGAISYYVKAKAYEQVLDWTSSDALLGRYNMEVEKIQMQETQEANSVYHGSVASVY